MLAFIILAAIGVWFVHFCLTWGKPRKRKHIPASAPLPTAGITPSDVVLVAVLAQTVTPPHHHCHH